MSWFKRECRHQAYLLAIKKDSTREQIDEDFDRITHHLFCRGCGKPVDIPFAIMRGGIEAFIERGKKAAPTTERSTP